MFKKKYIFETKRTKFLRYFQNSLFVLLVSTILYAIISLLFILTARNLNQQTTQNFFNLSPDLIVVFTGDSGRIPLAIEVAKKYKQSNIFITGVYSSNSVDSLLKPFELDGSFDSNMLTIDYLARNTVENVISTLRHLRENNGNKKIIVISHDYHIMRIKLIFNELMDSDENVEINYFAVNADYSNPRNIKIMSKELYKWIRTYAFLLLWSPE
ncbi:YdcF family protein [Halobacteriovorax sp. HLS]|uniref:YdcF family protein n=1 Tax=Halobacteriovorax sp. HLS TaxID=2234000 RepID=UPI000FD748A0|nr:YdcF family protein [Halobacteriovorax sp. HLS]